MSNSIIEFYNQYLDVFPVTEPSAVGWTNKATQHTRFKVLLDIGIKDYDSILDYGCGLGHLNAYMDLNGYQNIEYLGIDINPHYIFMAKMLYENRNFVVSDMETLNIEPVDYVIGSGVFTYGIELKDVVSKIELAYKLANIGVAFNFLDNESGIYGLLTYNKKEVMSRLSHIGNIELVDNYLGKEDFTIYIKK
jgi:SAM-dependent methyltransferase